ncbi:helicase A859L [Streptomyces rimosus subsp. rimosus]|nr:helicase A859L [Streptomyces rimosus subsp. rimosus]KOT44924.1 helicase A859L [Streptomyces sp. NRRL WC-3701]KOT64486.1 helicase A859L [Streptomyces rimosus subsp. rimosus]KOT66670.1 helicase A859L [Streptomyces rimosus subsp. rimosus]KOT83160.1 helicase A859L [Streptomyces rimosus subsp. rimosus]
MALPCTTPPPLRGRLVAQSFTVHLAFGSHRIENVTLQWGVGMDGDTRRDAPSWGTDIEVPAVIELLDLITAGSVTAEQARDKLVRLAVAINERKNREYEEMIELMEQPTPRAVREESCFDDRWVYAVSPDGAPDSIKIGVAKDIAQRIKSLQSGSATTLELRWSARGGYPLERYLHEQFNVRRTHGEWFDFESCPDPVAEIDNAAHAFLRQYAEESLANS